MRSDSAALDLSSNAEYSNRFLIVVQTELLRMPIDSILLQYLPLGKFAYILHNKEPGVPSHYHIYVDLNKSSSKIDIANWFRIHPGFIEFCNSSVSGVLYYMLRSTIIGMYKPSDIVANFDISEFINTSSY